MLCVELGSEGLGQGDVWFPVAAPVRENFTENNRVLIKVCKQKTLNKIVKKNMLNVIFYDFDLNNKQMVV